MVAGNTHATIAQLRQARTDCARRLEQSRVGTQVLVLAARAAVQVTRELLRRPPPA